jgi:mannan endo-1,4-beta-mannosidase
MDLIRSDGGCLLRDGRPWRFLLLNAYYLQDEAGQGAPAHTEAALDGARALGAEVVRAWAFNDRPDKASRMWSDLTTPVEEGLRALDFAVAQAGQRGLRLILALHDYWPAYGGMAQWLRWRGVAVDNREPPAGYAARFYGDGQLREAYRRRVRTLLGRVNTISGVRYGADPTILAWELMNEARHAPADWVSFAAECVRAEGQQLVALGDEDALDSADLDLASLHFYPEKHGASPGDELRFGTVAITEAARRVTRPLVVGEYALASTGLSLARRQHAWRAWFEAARTEPLIAGMGPWLLGYAGRPPDDERFIFYPGGDYDHVLLEAAHSFSHSFAQTR